MRYKVIGMWRSGSHLLQQLIEQNFDMELETDCDMEYFNIHRHSLPTHMHDVFIKEGNMIIISVKNPNLWIESIESKRPKWMKGDTCWANFQRPDKENLPHMVNVDLAPLQRQELISRYKEFTQAWMDFSPKVMFVKYEDLLHNAEAVFKDIEHFYNIKMKGDFQREVPKLDYSDSFDTKRIIRERDMRFYDIETGESCYHIRDNSINLYGIYLERREDRYKRLKERINNSNFKSLNITLMNESATGSFDASQIDKEDLSEYGVKPYKKWKIDADNHWWNKDITLGEVGCALGHIGMWEKAKERNDDISIFIEDDVKFTKNWQLKFRLLVDKLEKMDKEWDMIYLGRAPVAYNQEDVDTDVEEIVIPGFSYCLHGYAFSKRGLDKVLEKLPQLKSELFITDEYIPALYSRHPRDDINDKYGRDDFVCYAMKDEVIIQDDKDFAGSDTEEGGSSL